MSSSDRLKCSFCGKTQDQVKKLIAGPDVFICDECVELCNEILDEEFFESKEKNNDKKEKVSDDFNARFSAVGRGYLYRIVNRRAFPALERNRVWWVPYPLDVDLMRQGAQYLLGQHDFTSFRAAACQAKSPIKTLDRLDIVRDGDEIRFIVEARSFLHHQVRNMVGTLKMVGNRQIRPEEVKRILEARDRTRSGPNAPACGLYLNKVEY